jgi:hypothetical protein
MTEPDWLRVIDEPRRSELREMMDQSPFQDMARWVTVNASNEIMVQLIVDLRRFCGALNAANRNLY